MIKPGKKTKAWKRITKSKRNGEEEMKKIFEIRILPLKGKNNWVYITHPIWRLWLIEKLIGLEKPPRTWKEGGYYGRK